MYSLQQLLCLILLLSQVLIDIIWLRIGFNSVKILAFPLVIITVSSISLEIQETSEHGIWIVYLLILYLLTMLLLRHQHKDGHWWLIHKHKQTLGFEKPIKKISKYFDSQCLLSKNKWRVVFISEKSFSLKMYLKNLMHQLIQFFKKQYLKTLKHDSKQSNSATKIFNMMIISSFQLQPKSPILIIFQRSVLKLQSLTLQLHLKVWKNKCWLMLWFKKSLKLRIKEDNLQSIWLILRHRSLRLRKRFLQLCQIQILTQFLTQIHWSMYYKIQRILQMILNNS